jgi:FG-GAP-like repeat
MRRRLANGLSAPIAAAIVVLAAAPASGTTPVTFAPYDVVFLDESAVSVAIADVTGDGRQDVLLTTMYSGYHPETSFKLFLFSQMPDGSLGAPSRYPTDAQLNGPMGLATGDLDGDARPIRVGNGPHELATTPSSIWVGNRESVTRVPASGQPLNITGLPGLIGITACAASPTNMPSVWLLMAAAASPSSAALSPC